jgi:hypothetical protein
MRKALRPASSTLRGVVKTGFERARHPSDWHLLMVAAEEKGGERIAGSKQESFA